MERKNNSSTLAGMLNRFLSGSDGRAEADGYRMRLSQALREPAGNRDGIGALVRAVLLDGFGLSVPACAGMNAEWNEDGFTGLDIELNGVTVHEQNQSYW